MTPNEYVALHGLEEISGDYDVTLEFPNGEQINIDGSYIVLHEDHLVIYGDGIEIRVAKKVWYRVKIDFLPF